MPRIKLLTHIKADKELVFNLSRSIDLHKISVAQTNEEAIAGVTSGLIGLNEIVTWKGKHFGVTQKLTTKITEFNYSDNFTDEMVEGAFNSFKHQHIFTEEENGTLMTDIFDYQSPLVFLGKIADYLFLKRYMTRLLENRNQIIKEFAETDKWKEMKLD
jgi:ligand-binding SRPBCC domain-containing protein